MLWEPLHYIPLKSVCYNFKILHIFLLKYLVGRRSSQCALTTKHLCINYLTFYSNNRLKNIKFFIETYALVLTRASGLGMTEAMCSRQETISWCPASPRSGIGPPPWERNKALYVFAISRFRTNANMAITSRNGTQWNVRPSAWHRSVPKVRRTIQDHSQNQLFWSACRCWAQMRSIPQIDWWIPRFAKKRRWPRWGGARASALMYVHRSTDRLRCKIRTARAVHWSSPTLRTYSFLILFRSHAG